MRRDEGRDELPGRRPSDPGDPRRRWTLPARIVDAKTGVIVGEEAFYRDLLSVRTVYFAEQHDNPHDHAAEATLVEGLCARDPSLAIGLEMVNRPFQTAVDEYVARRIDEPAFLARTEWAERWGFSFELYRPIFELAQAHRLSVRALNAKDELVNAVARSGIAGLAPTWRRELPELDLTNAAHRAELEEVFGAHGVHGGSFENFYAAQVLWDETMAEEVARTLTGPDSPHRILVLAGDGHVRHGLGIPSRAKRRGTGDYRIIVPIMADDLEAERAEGGADYLWVMAPSKVALPGHDV